MGAINPAACVLLLGLAVWGWWLVAASGRRSSEDVLEDLRDVYSQGDKVADANDRKVDPRQRMAGVLSDELGAIGLYHSAERAHSKLRSRLIPLVSAGLAVAGASILFSATISQLLVSAVIGLSAGYILVRLRYARARARFVRQIEFFLPVVMERVVMAVQAGLDVVAALRAILDQERFATAAGSGSEKQDPVSRLLEFAVQMTEAGMSFEKGLEEVADVVECTALRHAFIHLALAYREGGELVMPLIELSDSTQLYFQESVEEEIAKMPVKAVMPLICTFAGLIIVFVTSPLIQVLGIMSKAMPK